MKNTANKDMTKKVKTVEELFLCECGDTSDQVIMQWFDDQDDEYPNVYVSFFLRKKPLWERIKLGIQYIFGKRSKYGEFGEVILKPEDYEKMQKVTDFLKKSYDAIEKKET